MASPTLRPVGWALALSAIALLAACMAGYSPKAVHVGQTADQVVQSMGQPTGRHVRADGTRLEYARGPYGRHTYMIDLDASGRVKSVDQVLRDEVFMSIQPGIDRTQLLATLGRPSDDAPGGWQGGRVWSYRYEHIPSFCQWFQVSLDDRGLVTSAAYGPDPLCFDADRRRSK